MKFDFTKAYLDKMVIVVLSEETPFEVIKKADELIDMVKLKDKYGRDYNIKEDLLVRFEALKRIVKFIVVDKLRRGKEKISEYIDVSNEFGKQVREYIEHQEVISPSTNDIKFVEKSINTKLKYNIIDAQATKIINFLQDFQDDSKSLQIEDLVEEYGNLIARTNSDFLRLRNAFDDKKKSFVMDKDEGEKLEELLDSYIRSINNKSRYVKTGIKWFNDTFGGWEKERLYLLAAASGRGKSVLLLNSAIWAVKYNTFEDVSKTGLKPVVLYITLENTIVETILRLLGYVGGKKVSDDFRKGSITIEDASRLAFSEIINKKDPSASAQLRLEYRNKGTQNIADINKMIDDVEADGKHKVVFAAIDYIDSIRSDYIKKDDIRMGLDQLGKELSNMAKDREIPIVTAMQLNREATNKIESGADDTEEYFRNVRNIGASNIAESLRLIQLIDLGLMIDKRKSEVPGEPDSLAFRIIKTRVELNGSTPTRLHVHSFEKDNGMRLVEDIYDPVSKSHPIIQQELTQTRGSTAPKLNPRR